MNRIRPLVRILACFCVTVVAASCSSSGSRGMVTVDSANQDSRVNVVVIHHTSEDFGGSLDILTQPSAYPVSSHYLVPEPMDPSYEDGDLKVYALVPEQQRAWHAGNSYWAGQTKLNNVSVGIEIVNETYCHRAPDMTKEETADWPSETICFYPDYPENQLALVIDLVQGILERHPEVKPTHVVGHSDIAPQRKIDLPEGKQFLIVPETGAGPDYPFSGEKLTVTMALYKVKDIDEAIELTKRGIDLREPGPHSLMEVFPWPLTGAGLS